jgi:adenine deaminase
MLLAFMPLSVIPALKITDRGLVDVTTFEFTPLQE